MWSVIILLVIILWVVLHELLPLIKRGLKREWIACSIVLFIGSSLVLLHGLGITLKNPLDWLYAFYNPWSDFILRQLQ